MSVIESQLEAASGNGRIRHSLMYAGEKFLRKLRIRVQKEQHIRAQAPGPRIHLQAPIRLRAHFGAEEPPGDGRRVIDTAAVHDHNGTRFCDARQMVQRAIQNDAFIVNREHDSDGHTVVPAHSASRKEPGNPRKKFRPADPDTGG